MRSALCYSDGAIYSNFTGAICNEVNMSGIADKPVCSIQFFWNVTVLEEIFVGNCKYFSPAYIYKLNELCDMPVWNMWNVPLECFGSIEALCNKAFEVPDDPCSTTPCRHGGECHSWSTIGSEPFHCHCLSGFTGSFCEMELDPSSTNGATVQWEPGTTNESTTEATDMDIPTYFATNATTKATLNPFPETTEIITNRTTEPPVVGQTTRTLSPKSSQCSDIRPVPCHTQPCNNNGVCVNNNITTNCSCSPGFIGVVCTCDIDECASNPCEEGQTCLDLLNGFFCEDPCYSHQCANGSTCMNRNGTATCMCPAGLECSPTFAQPTMPTIPKDKTLQYICIGIGTGIVVLCVPLVFVLHRYYQTKRKLKASRRALRTEHEIVDRMSSAHFANPAYQSDKEVQGKLHARGNIPPPISPRPIISLPAGNEPGNDIYADYIYIDRPEAHKNFSSSHEGTVTKEASANGEYIYVVDTFGNKGNGGTVDPSGMKMVLPLPSAPPPCAGEYIYFDQSVSSKAPSGSEEYIYVEEPTDMKSSGNPLAVNPSPLGSPKKPAPPIASVRPLPLKPPATSINDYDDINKRNENLYEELPDGNQTKPIDNVAGDIDLDNDMYLKPDNITM